MKDKLDTKYLTKASLIAALYTLLVLIQLPMGTIAFGPIQLRLAEGLTLLPLIESAAVPGLFIGCIISNIILSSFSAFGILDIIGGSLVTLLAAFMTSKMKNKFTGALPPIILNGLIVSIWVSYFTGLSYSLTAISIALGEAASVVILGNIFLSIYEKTKSVLN